MAPTLAALLRCLDPAALDPPGDDALLHKYAATGDRDALAALVHRHGPLVYRVCRQLLHPDDVEDGFQATFLVLARRAGAVRKAGSVGNWLVGVAGRVAREARRAERRRARREVPLVGEVADVVGARSGDLERAEQVRLLHEELARLPDRLRGPVVACVLQGRTSDVAAAELGSSPRTVRRRVEQARQVLRARLERRGVAPAVAAVLLADVDGGTAAVPTGLVHRTVEVLNDYLAGGISPLAVLSHGVATVMTPRKALTFLEAATCLTALGAGLAGGHPDAAAPVRPPNSTSMPVAAPIPEHRRGQEFYYPTRVSDRLTYNLSNEQLTIVVSAVDRTGGRLVVTTAQSRTSERLVRYAKVEVSESTLLVLGHAEGEPGKANTVRWETYSPPHVLFRSAARPGDRWQYQPGLSVWCTVGRQELVRVPAGEFRAVPVGTRVGVAQDPGVRWWFAPGVGAVKWTTDRGDTVLRSFVSGKE